MTMDFVCVCNYIEQTARKLMYHTNNNNNNNNTNRGPLFL